MVCYEYHCTAITNPIARVLVYLLKDPTKGPSSKPFKSQKAIFEEAKKSTDSTQGPAPQAVNCSALIVLYHFQSINQGDSKGSTSSVIIHLILGAKCK